MHKMIRVLNMVACTNVFILFHGRDWHQFCIFTRFGLFPQFFWAGYGVSYIRIAWHNKSDTCTCVPSCFYLVLWSRYSGRSAQIYKKWSFFHSFTRLCPLPQVLGQVKEWPMLKLYKIIRVSHQVECPVFHF